MAGAENIRDFIMKPVVLIIEDDPDGLRSVAEVVSGLGAETVKARTGEEGIEAFRKASPDVVLTDLVLPDIDGIEVLSRLSRMAPRVPVLMMTAYGSVESSVSAMRAGAYDYIPKPLELDELQSKMRRAIETSRLRRQVEHLSRSMRDRYAVQAMVAASDAMQDVLHQIEALADTDATILIRGESGTGKELVARALHLDSHRAEGPFVAVNCGAFSETLLESELFGHEKGAFTGAYQQHPGAFERADGGTLFLDEIGDAPAPVQVKLLRAIEEREIRRIGGRDPFQVNVRIVSATHHDLEARVAEGNFREDLYYRINVVSIRIPPLRRRLEDIRPLADRFIAEACERHGRTVMRVDPAFYDALEAFLWPGNIRQLRNVVESAVLLAPGTTLDADCCRLPLGSQQPVKRPDTPTSEPDDPMRLDELERDTLARMLERNQGNRTLTAQQLGISRRTIQRKIKAYDLPY